MPPFSRRTSSYQPAQLEPDFQAAFGSDDEDDAPDSSLGAAGRSGRAPASLAELDNQEQHHRTSTQQSETDSLPGAYNFEPQTSQSALSPALRPASFRGARPATAQSTLARPTSNSLNFVTQLGNRFLGRFGVQPIGGYSNVSRSDEDEHSSGDEHSPEGRALLFSTDGQGHDTTEHDSMQSYPPRNNHIPLPARPPVFSAPAGGPQTGTGRVFGGGQGNDGVFANLAAKPDGVDNGADFVGGDEDGPGKDEVLPAYEVALADTTPAYWETTVITPGGLLGPDDICVDGLPVGSLFAFAWSLLVSMSFQFIGFFLTYLLHTTHAAKNGSRAGLGITLIQLGFYLKQRIDHPELDYPGDSTGLNGMPGGTADDRVSWSWWGGIQPLNSTLAAAAQATATAASHLPANLHESLSSALDASDPDASRLSATPTLSGFDGAAGNGMSTTTNEWMAFFLVTFGSFLLIGGCLSYWRAVRWARAVRSGMGPQGDAEARVAA